MEIKYFALLNNNPTHQAEGSDYVEKLKSLSLEEIVSLENAYNNGRQDRTVRLHAFNRSISEP